MPFFLKTIDRPDYLCYYLRNDHLVIMMPIETIRETSLGTIWYSCKIAVFETFTRMSLKQAAAKIRGGFLEWRIASCLPILRTYKFKKHKKVMSFKS